MKDRKQFEIDSSELLNSRFDNSEFNFAISGGSNSNESDIHIIRNKLYIESIEAKVLPCQSGQVVILPVDGKFIFSSRSIYKDNPFSELILNHMNQNFSKYNKISTGGIPIQFDKSEMFSWIKHHYIQDKSSNYLIAGNLKDFKVFIPFSEIDSYFDVKCSYRKKRSGTSELPLMDESIFYNGFIPQLNNLDVSIIKRYCTKSRKPKADKLFVEISNKLSKKDLYLEFDGFTSFLSFKSESSGIFTYEIRKRSNTNSPNIIFSLSLINKLPNNFGFDKFKNYILNL